ncbi:sodium-dependent transporter, partial [Lachnospiraceae bacterium OttesenSCG-928-J05]|nr:sodium-dependent transporter [Lachnospiraceae bacterium OttesenSCG-928-J05]
MNTEKKQAEFGSRFGYIMVAAGAAIGLGNIWRFPFLAYRGGGGIFILFYILIAIFMGHPMVEMETAIGRFGRGNVAASFGKVKKKYTFIGIIAVICTTCIDVYYVVVGGWVIKY